MAYICVNYEARTERSPDEKRIKRKTKNYKLKFSRMLTCYSALLYLLAIYQRDGTVSPADARVMTSLSPTKRLEWLLAQHAVAHAHEDIRDLLAQYENFLAITCVGEKDLIKQFTNRDVGRRHIAEASKFGDAMFRALMEIGNESALHRLIVV